MSLRGEIPSANLQSRPLGDRTKNLSTFKQWIAGHLPLRGHKTLISAYSSQSTSRIRSHSNGTASVISISSSSFEYGEMKSQANGRKQKVFDCKNRRNMKSIMIDFVNRDESLHQTSECEEPTNAMQWMQSDCPKDVLPLILAFAGPQQIAVVQRVNQFWYRTINHEGTWRRLCEELHKWKVGDEVPISWKQHYQHNPCVPVDYASIHGALKKVIGRMKKDTSAMSPSVRILLRPGIHVLEKPIVIGDDENHRTFSIKIEGMNHLHGNRIPEMRSPHIFWSVKESKRKRKSSIRNILGCRAVDEREDEDFIDYENLHCYLNNKTEPIEGAETNGEETILSEIKSQEKKGDERFYANQVALVMNSRQEDKPLLNIREGFLTMSNVDLVHCSRGTNIWSGNAAVQIQPPTDAHDRPLATALPSVTLHRVDVTSLSGRGIVNIDGGNLFMKDCYVHNCAATGIYVGGTSSRASIQHTDVILNGIGNKRHRQGVFAGHSGLYLEQGDVAISDCNISRNVLTGISAIDDQNAVLKIERSYLISNGSQQLELPRLGSVARGKCQVVDTIEASEGCGRPQSSLVLE